MKKETKNFIMGFIVACMLVVPFTSFADTIEVYFNKVSISVDGKKAANQNEDYKLSNGTEVPFSITYKDTTYIPIRKVGELLGIGIDYDNVTKEVKISKSGTQKPIDPTIPTDPAVPTEPIKPEDGTKPEEPSKPADKESFVTEIGVIYDVFEIKNSKGERVQQLYGFLKNNKLSNDTSKSLISQSDIEELALWNITKNSSGVITDAKKIQPDATGLISEITHNAFALEDGKWVAVDNDVTSYRAAFDRDGELDNYRLSHIESINTGYNVSLYDTDGNGKYDVVIYYV